MALVHQKTQNVAPLPEKRSGVRGKALGVALPHHLGESSGPQMLVDFSLIVLEALVNHHQISVNLVRLLVKFRQF